MHHFLRGLRSIVKRFGHPHRLIPPANAIELPSVNKSEDFPETNIAAYKDYGWITSIALCLNAQFLMSDCPACILYSLS
ncbi:hypothetical protein L596_002336 [Steinernema carpocapsae]|uniref:Uncharacterized protein n=1 Tax=Steinernema carpocapsae TaxID=34508 RepID=A0A4U8UP79_STECR|nr:hypothetical protein L596_002336 [Steinernema carpocapsae]